MYEKIMCPLMGEEIDDAICFDIHMVSENLSPEYFAPEKVVKTKGYKEICLQCPHHRE